MSYATAQQIVQAHDRAKDQRRNFDIEWQRIADEGIGRRQFTVRQQTKGLARFGFIVDATMRQSHQMLTGALMGLLANPETAWLDVQPADDDIRGIPAVDEWFREVTIQTLRSFQRPEARWASAFSESLFDGTGFGTGALATMSDPLAGPYFMARPLPEIHISEDDRGNIDTIFREFPYTARQCQLAFGTGIVTKGEGNTKSEAVNQAIEKNPEKEFRVLEIIHRITDPAAQLGKLELLDKPWRTVHVLLEPATLLREGGYFENPINVWRWGKEAGELYGIGPGWIALPDAQTLNQMGISMLKMGQRNVEPPLLVPDDGVLTQLNGAPNSINIVRSDLMMRSRGNPIVPLPTGSNFPITRELMEDKRRAVRETFFANLLQLFNDPRMTATQVLELSAEAQRLMAPMLSRIKSELLDPTVNRVFQINQRDGRYPPPPQILEGRELKVEYTSPVLRAQRQPEAQTVLQIYAAAGQIGQIDPSVFDNLDPDESIRIIHEALGGPPSMVRGADQVEQIRAAQAQLAQQQAQLEQARQVSEIAGNVPPELLAGAGGAEVPQAA
jgi:hypothetical protein